MLEDIFRETMELFSSHKDTERRGEYYRYCICIGIGIPMANLDDATE